MPRDGVWSVSEKWKNTDFSAYMSTPLLFDDILLAFSNNRKGTYVSLDVNTGKELWKSQGREGENAAMIRAGDSLLSIVTDGNLVVARKTGVAFSPVKVYQVADTPIWAHPVLFDRHIAVKDRERLTLWRLE
jgi:outer membrane protein assembly factor BamB